MSINFCVGQAIMQKRCPPVGVCKLQDLAATLVIYTCIILHHVVGTVAILAKHSPAIQVRMQRTAVAIAVIATRSTAFTE